MSLCFCFLALSDQFYTIRLCDNIYKPFLLLSATATHLWLYSLRFGLRLRFYNIFNFFSKANFVYFTACFIMFIICPENREHNIFVNELLDFLLVYSVV